MTDEIVQVTRLQSLDLRIAELDREVATLPKHIAQIERALDAHLRRLEADRAALVANQKERKQLEDDVKVENQKISKLRDQMLGAKTNEQYRAFQHEISFCETAIRTAEDRILDLMAESEPLDANVKKAEVALKEEKQQVESEKAQARERTAVDQKQLDELRTERQQLVAALRKPAYSASVCTRCSSIRRAMRRRMVFVLYKRKSTPETPRSSFRIREKCGSSPGCGLLSSRVSRVRS